MQKKRQRKSALRHTLVPKLCGGDYEVGNFVLGLDSPQGTGSIASRALVEQVDGIAAQQRFGIPVYGVYTNSPPVNPQDVGRVFLPTNSSSVYVDLDHAEVCIPEVRDAFSHLAAGRAMITLLRHARDRANRELPEGQRIEVLLNNSDGLGHSYGTHLNFLISREAWRDLFGRRLHYLLFLASHEASSVVLTGQGKVGSENGRAEVDYQISQRADFFETLFSEQTTLRRPLVNTRNEALCGEKGATGPSSANRYARLHCIFYDNTLCHTASVLKVGMMQIVLAMIEAGNVDTDLLLDEPLRAVHTWSHDPGLSACEPLAGGKKLTAVEHQLRILDQAERFAAGGVLDGIVPRADEILGLWRETLEMLARNDLDRLSGRIDWVLKRRIIEDALGREASVDWKSDDACYLDQIYPHIDPETGLYWGYEEAGIVERLVDEQAVAALVDHPPRDTRAWTRAMLLRAAGPSRVRSVDWDSVTVRIDGARGWPRDVRIVLDDPLGFTEAQCARVFADQSDLEHIVSALARESEGFAAH